MPVIVRKKAEIEERSSEGIDPLESLELILENEDVIPDSISRADFSKFYAVEYNIKVSTVGRIAPKDTWKIGHYALQAFGKDRSASEAEPSDGSARLSAERFDIARRLEEQELLAIREELRRTSKEMEDRLKRVQMREEDQQLILNLVLGNIARQQQSSDIVPTEARKARSGKDTERGRNFVEGNSRLSQHNETQARSEDWESDWETEFDFQSNTQQQQSGKAPPPATANTPIKHDQG